MMAYNFAVPPPIAPAHESLNESRKSKQSDFNGLTELLKKEEFVLGTCIIEIE